MTTPYDLPARRIPCSFEPNDCRAAKQLADDEWRNEHAQILSEILANSGITDTLSIDGREVPIESVIKAIRESFLAHRSKQLIQKLTDKVVTAAFKKVTEEENQ
jgi:hypothetical protein